MFNDSEEHFLIVFNSTPVFSTSPCSGYDIRFEHMTKFEHTKFEHTKFENSKFEHTKFKLS